MNIVSHQSALNQTSFKVFNSGKPPLVLLIPLPWHFNQTSASTDFAMHSS